MYSCLIDSSERNTRLDNAYQNAESVTREFSKSFYLASGVLPAAQRRAIRALYGFCRLTDNLVDDPQEMTNGSDLSWWRAEVNRPWQQQNRDVLIAWAHTRESFNVPQCYGDELIEGCENDLTRTRYETFAQLQRYCYCVASTVGLMAIPILGLKPGINFAQAEPYAVKLGIALQLTNILRDVGEDLMRGRIYLPLEDLERFKVTEDDLLSGCLHDNVIRLLQFEIARTDQLYREAWPGIGLLGRQARFAAALAAEVYRGILGKIKLNGYDVFTRRAFLTRTEKLSRIPVIWLRVRLAPPTIEV